MEPPFNYDVLARAFVAMIIIIIAASLGSCADGASIARYCLMNPARC